jgi:hypothetical protein
MAEQIIYLKPADDRASIRDRLDRVEARRVLVVLPPADEPIQDRLDLILLQRQAGLLGVELGLVTTNVAIVAEARALGIPAFPSVQVGQRRRWRWPWRPPRGPRPAQRPGPPDRGDVREMYRRTAPRPEWRRWLSRLGGIVLFTAVLVALGVSIVYIVPSATVVVYSDTQELSVTTIAVGDPASEVADYDAGLVPARLIRVEVSWSASAAATGYTDVPDAPAIGTVVFINRQAEPVSVPAGTVVRTSAGTTTRFRTTNSTEVPGGSGGRSEALIAALDAGPLGNVDANMINQIEGALALQLRVRNLSPTSGGGVRQDKAVTQADLDRLRGQVLQQCFQLAKAEMGNWMSESEFLAEESLALFLVINEDYSRYVGERADSVELEMIALIQGYAVDGSEGYGIVYTALVAETPPGYRLLPDGISLRRGEVLGVDDDGRVTFLMQGQATVAADIDRSHIVQVIRGQRIAWAASWIPLAIPIEGEPAIHVWPLWFGRLPYLPIRITVRVETP